MLGVFDGLHEGHQGLLASAKKDAEARTRKVACSSQNAMYKSQRHQAQAEPADDFHTQQILLCALPCSRTSLLTQNTLREVVRFNFIING